MARTRLLKPTSVDEALSQLSDVGERGRVLSGGATLVAMMNAQLVEADYLISLKNIDELQEVARAPDGSVRIGAMRRHRQTAFETDLRDGQCVVSKAASQIANPPVRNMGTMGGSIAFADPAADYPPALVAADAQVEIAGMDGRRRVDAQVFFSGWYETALEPGEVVTAVIVPAASRQSVGHYAKLCRVVGDFAIASVALNLSFEANDLSNIEAKPSQVISFVRLAIGGCGGGPVRVPEAEEILAGTDLNDDVVQKACDCVVAALDPIDDVRASADYRLKVVPRMIKKALMDIAIDSADEVTPI